MRIGNRMDLMESLNKLHMAQVIDEFSGELVEEQINEEFPEVAENE